MSDYTVEHHTKIWSNDTGYCVELGPDEEGFECIEIRHKDPNGNITETLMFEPVMAKLVGEALIELTKNVQ